MTLKITAVALLLVASCSTGQTNSQPSLFSPAIRIALTNKPSNIALADINKDGRLDLVVASEQGRSVMILPGQAGDPPFRATNPQTITVPEDPGNIAVGDLNGDDRLDIAMDSHDSYAVTILLGDGKGNLSLAANSPIIMKQGQQPHTHGLGVGDLNGDGKLDLATANNADNDVSVAFGDGRGGFTLAPRSPFAVAPSPYPFALHDVNGDGRLDIVSTASGTGPARAQILPLSRVLTLLLADGQAGFRASQIPLRTGEPWFVAIADLNGDSKPDLVVTHHEQNALTVLLGNGVGGFREISSSPFDLGHNAWQIALADVNRDRHPDAIMAAGDNIRVHLGDGTGSFKPAAGSPFATAAGTWRVTVGDVNQDGKPDVVTSNSDANSVTVLLGR